MLDKLFGLFSKDIGVDLGTANTLIYVRGRGIVISEPSVVAVNQKTSEIIAVGEEARRMVGRTPGHIVAMRPLVQGVISDFEITEKMLKYFFDKVHRDLTFSISRPRVVIGIPSGVTDVERRAVEDAAKNAGAREVYLVEEPMAAAIGARLPVQEPVGNMVIDIGGGTSEIAVISLGGIVSVRSLRIAGDRLNEDIIRYARDKHKLLIGERTAEETKIAVGSATELPERMTTRVRGRDLATGLPREISVSDKEVREAMRNSLEALLSAVKETIEDTPPELLTDIMVQGIILAGGGSLLRGIDGLITRETGIAAKVTDDPLTAVVRGTGIILEDIDRMASILKEQTHNSSELSA